MTAAMQAATQTATQTDWPISVAALYKFAALPDCAGARAPLARLCCANGVKGTLLLAPEGINGTISGTDAAIGRVLDHIRHLVGADGLEVKFSRAAAHPFHRMKVRLKREKRDALSSPSMRQIKDGGSGPAKPIITHKGKVVGTPTDTPTTADVPTTAS